MIVNNLINTTKLKATKSNTSKKATAPAIRAYLGGSFNPVHNGHIQMAMQVYDALAPIATEQQRLLEVSLLPNARSPFKDQTTDPSHRLAMLTLAIKDTPLQISALELWQEPPVYTINSVRTLRQRYPNDSLIFIMGMDSARSLEKWKDGLQLTDYVHLWIFNRTDVFDITQPKQTVNNSNITDKLCPKDIATLCAELPSQLQSQVTDTATDLMRSLDAILETGKRLKSNAQGRIYIDPRQVTAISSTQIRQQLREPALKPIQINKFTANNKNNADNKNNPLTKCLNPTVYQYIIAHQLYSAV